MQRAIDTIETSDIVIVPPVRTTGLTPSVYRRWFRIPEVARPCAKLASSERRTVELQISQGASC
jgi:hypothetical protein